jgi:TonB family protein
VKKADLYGIIGSVLSCMLLFLILWLIVLPVTPEVKDDEGIMVSFGDATDGAGVTETPAAQPEAATPKTVTAPKPVKQEYMTSTDPNALAIAEQKKKDKKEKEALEKQRLENERAIAEKKRKEQEAIDKANAMGGLFGKGGTGSGTTTGNTTQGNPAGSGSSGGNSWSLSGRSLNGSLVQPKYDNDVEGKVTVNIRVDASGVVIGATIGSPTTISDQATRNAALAAANGTRFTGGSGTASGTITYNFRLK